MEVDLSALTRNAAVLASHAGVPLLPMVKADAYGLGAREVVGALETLEPWGYGVATVDEGIELRDRGVTRPVVVFTPLLPGELAAASAARLTPSLGSERSILEWKEYGGPWHLSIDTGMSRAGVAWLEVPSMRSAAAALPPEGAFTHFHSAELDDASVAEQESRFRKAVASLDQRPRLLHTDASAAIIRRGRSDLDLIRPGIFMYGVQTVADPGIDPDAVVHVRSRVVETRWLAAGDTVSYNATYTAASARLVATIAIGYGDGYPRSLGNIGEAIIRGRRAAIVGRVTMDMIMLDVTDIGCSIGDIATLIGRDTETNDLIAVAKVASQAGMSPYELLTGLRGRLPRIHIE